MTSSWTAKAVSIPRAPSASESTGSTPRSANDLFMRPFVARLQAEARGEFRLDRPDVLRLRTLLALLGVVGDLRALGERAVSVGLNRCVVDEEVLARLVRGDESEALLVREPLHCSGRHVSFTSTALCVLQTRRSLSRQLAMALHGFSAGQVARRR